MITGNSTKLQIAAHFYAEELNIPDTVLIQVDRLRQINCAGSGLDSNDINYVEGLCIPLEARLKAYYIAIHRRVGPKRRYRILAHEMTHVSQYYTKRLTYSKDGNITYWEGNAYYLPRTEALSYDEYASLPWELEAREAEEVLFNKFLGELNGSTSV